MMKVSVMNYNYQRYPFEYFLDSMVRLDVDAIELWAAEPHLYVEDLPKERLIHIQNEIKQRELKVVCFTPEQCVYPVNIAAKDDRLRNRSIEYFKKSLNVAVELGSPLLLVVPGSGYYNEPKEEGFKRSSESLQILGQEAEKLGVTAKLLGFDSPTQNSLDGVASRDYLLEILSALSIFSNGLSRLAHDLYLWSTSEFSYIEVGNSVAICSSIMPQKKNPYTLEHIKAKAAHVQAALVSCLGSLKNTPFTHSCDVCLESPRYFWDAVYEVEASISIMIATIKTVKVNKELMLQRALKNFSTVTELANLLVREAGLSFTEAHRVVASLVNDLLQQDQTPEYIDPQKLSQFALDLLGKEIHLCEVHLRQALHPVTNVQLKSVKGGPSPKEVLSQLEGLSEQLKSDKYELGEKVDQIEDARGLLKEKADQMLKC